MSDLVAPEEPSPQRPRQRGHGGAWLGFVLALVLPAVATLAALAAEPWAPAAALTLIYVLPVVVLAARFGWGAAITASVLGVLSYNFFLTDPRGSLQVADSGAVWSVILLAAAAAVVSAVGAQARRRGEEARRHAERSDALQVLARAIAAATDEAQIARAAVQAVSALFDAPAAVLIQADDDFLQAASRAGPLGEDDLDAARWALGADRATRAGAYPVERSSFDFWPVRVLPRRRAVIALRLPDLPHGRPPDTDRVIESVAGHLAVALERDAYARQVLEDRLRLESERVKSDLLAAVSHDLRTPLATILFSLQSLRTFGDAHDAGARADLLRAAESETARLSGLVENLLDMSRIDADALAVHPATIAPAELVADALERARPALHGRNVRNTVDPCAPLVRADPALAVTALANVLDNAGKYAPSGSTVTVDARVADEALELRVSDQGPGFPPEAEALFGKFARGVEGDGRPPGTGLGLAIARGFLAAQGGSIRVEAAGEGAGATVVLRLPLAAAERGIESGAP